MIRLLLAVLLVVLCSNSTRAQLALRVNAPYAVPAALSPSTLMGALDRVSCRQSDPCVVVREAPSTFYDDALLVVVAAEPSEGPGMLVRAWLPELLPDDEHPRNAVPASATETAWRGVRRWDWSVFGRHAAYVEIASGRSVETGTAESRAAVDNALDRVDIERLQNAPDEPAYVLPLSRRLYWSPEEAQKAAAEERARFVSLILPTTLENLLPDAPENEWEVLTSSGFVPFYTGGESIPSSYAELAVHKEAGPLSIPDARITLLNFGPHLEDDVERGDRRTTVTGYPALVYDSTDATYTLSSPLLYDQVSRAVESGAIARPDSVQLIDVAVGEGRHVHAAGADTALAARLLRAVPFKMLAEVPSRQVAFAQRTRYVSSSTDPFVGVHALPGSPDRVRAVSAHGSAVEFTLASDQFVSSPAASTPCPHAIPRDFLVSDGIRHRSELAVLTSLSVDPCVGFAADGYPDSQAAVLARERGLVVVEEHGPIEQFPLAWVSSWPALRHALLPTWALPLMPSGPPEQRKAGPHQVLSYSLASDGERIPGAFFAVEALFLNLDGRLVSVVAAASTPADARNRADALAATLRTVTTLAVD